MKRTNGRRIIGAAKALERLYGGVLLYMTSLCKLSERTRNSGQSEQGRTDGRANGRTGGRADGRIDNGRTDGGPTNSRTDTSFDSSSKLKIRLINLHVAITQFYSFLPYQTQAIVKRKRKPKTIVLTYSRGIPGLTISLRETNVTFVYPVASDFVK